MSSPRVFLRRALLLTALGAGAAMPASAQTATAVDLQAAFLINFARFTEWPASQNGTALRLCVVGDERLAKAATTASRGQRADGRPLEVRSVAPGAAVDTCGLLFIGRTVKGDTARMLTRARALPILTVSDAEGFAAASGIIQLIVDEGHMRFAVNAGMARDSGLRLSSRLLGLAKVIYGG